jgi:hypothetical protein
MPFVAGGAADNQSKNTREAGGSGPQKQPSICVFVEAEQTPLSHGLEA